MSLQHFSHQHPLEFIKNWKSATEEEEEEEAICIGCEEPVEGPSYCCISCRYYLHESCAELPPEIDHPFHPPHPLFLLPKSPNPSGKFECNFCRKLCSNFVFHCSVCDFNLDVNCSLLQLSIPGDFHKLDYCFHDHPLIFNEKHNKKIGFGFCFGCTKPLYGQIYRCLHCTDFDLHKQCAELALEINHPYHRKHPLILLPNPPTHQQGCSCYFCKIEWKMGFVYYCSTCKFGLTLEDVQSLPMITVSNHEHPWFLVSRPISFICDACGTDGDYTPYQCITCNLFVHKNCISLPRTLKITRHPHRLSHIYFLQQNQPEIWMCRICHTDVDTEYGSYYCSKSECNYIAHVNCATNKHIWDETAEGSEQEPSASINLITNVIKELRMGEDLIATEIKHAYHDHNLLLSLNGEVKDDNICDGCMLPISNPFYSCEQCIFFLHKYCAELPREKEHPVHKHPLTLTNGGFSCSACHRNHHGFSYKCNVKFCYFKMDIRCSSQSDTLKHPSHEHLLFLDHNYQGNCSGCPNKTTWPLYRCTKRCEFAIDFSCVTLPHSTWYKYDRHPLALTYHDDPDPDQHYCDFCEEKRHPIDWFYDCADCGNSIHTGCTLGELPFIKPGSIYKSTDHPHPLTFVKNIWNCIPCKVCNKLCNGQALECKESECNLIMHWECRWFLK